MFVIVYISKIRMKLVTSSYRGSFNSAEPPPITEVKEIYSLTDVKYVRSILTFHVNYGDI